MLDALVALQLITVHNVEGQAVFINTRQIVSLRDARESSDRLVTGGVRCMVMLADGKYQAVVEDCAAVRKLIEERQPWPK